MADYTQASLKRNRMEMHTVNGTESDWAWARNMVGSAQDSVTDLVLVQWTVGSPSVKVCGPTSQYCKSTSFLRNQIIVTITTAIKPILNYTRFLHI